MSLVREGESCVKSPSRLGISSRCRDDYSGSGWRKADKAGALSQFTKGEGGFKDRDLYPFCGGPDGKFTAHPKLVGQSLKDLKDKAGKALGAEMYQVAQEGKVAEVAYMWPRPGSTDPVPKVSFVTRVGDQVCAVGYYK